MSSVPVPVESEAEAVEEERAWTVVHGATAGARTRRPRGLERRELDMARKRCLGHDASNDGSTPERNSWNRGHTKERVGHSLHSLLSRDRRRHATKPGWEPVVQRPAKKIEESPHLEEAALKSLQRQGCQNPMRHYYPEHECEVPRRRLDCLRHIARWKRDRPLVEEVAIRLPKELAIHVFEYVVLASQPHTAFHDEHTLATTARLVIGPSDAADSLVPLAEQALLEQSIFDIDVAFRRAEGQRMAVLPPDLSTRPHPLRKARVTLDLEIPIGRQKYPAILYIATACMPSLLAQLPALRHLHFFFRIELTRPPWDHQGSALDVACRKGFSGTSTFRKALEELLDAVKAVRPGIEVYVEISYMYEGTWRGAHETPPKTYNVAMEDLTAEDAIRGADAKWQNCRFSLG
ncbi:uncharacterized protein MYCFIDRAFT_216980 [Pseudocercospora fijiensis CIRAD86]|uniref:Uncharacterized protein n=1 Tax=Pseudocercospora fijiensis (strain CIRAD86) TaxID=383855 RepID=M2YK29_PSEFD|nr:uncharacterized protein MYCFIDRAFT_216980 [Pseudocercospora fijiensis CIRAD86]EME78115.1 hypothetical protein MYCFIDRAFT_216980 [Pseudocercospora fijiensis CIRAD86]